jgi:hypothetical protein
MKTMHWANPETVTETGQALNRVGSLKIPEGDIKLKNGMLLKYRGKGNITGEYERHQQAHGLVEAGEWVTSDRLVVVATIDNHEHGRLLHVSISYPKRDPSWGIIKAVRDAFYPPDVDVAMMLPRQEDFINLHQHCFQMHQLPEKWGLR